MKTTLNIATRLIAAFVLGLLACHINPIELVRRGLLKDPLLLSVASRTNAFAGLTTLNSGTAFVTISTAAVASGQLIYAQLSVATTCGSGIGYQTGVSSIVDGVSFAYGYIDGQGRAPGGTVMWEIRKSV